MVRMERRARQNAHVLRPSFTDATRRVHGRRAEVLDAFVFGKFAVGDGSATVRAGRRSLLWGESLFFGANAIAGGQQPVDVVKLLSVPSTQFKEAIRPVPQISGQVQVSANISVGAYPARTGAGSRHQQPRHAPELKHAWRKCQ